MNIPKTLYEKLIGSHTVCQLDDKGHVLLYIDRQVLNEYTSPQAFSGLRDANRDLWRANTSLAVVDHVNSTEPQRVSVGPQEGGALQVNYFAKNCEKFGKNTEMMIGKNSTTRKLPGIFVRKLHLKKLVSYQIKQKINSEHCTD